MFILGAAATNNEINQKYKWLEKNYPNIKKEHIIFICSTMLKPEVILAYSKKLNIDLNDIVFVDDRTNVYLFFIFKNFECSQVLKFINFVIIF